MFFRKKKIFFSKKKNIFSEKKSIFLKILKNGFFSKIKKQFVFFSKIKNNFWMDASTRNMLIDELDGFYP